MTEVARTIPLSKLVPSEANVRHTNPDVGLGELAASIKVHGILQNLIVRPVKKANGKHVGTFEVVAGGRRYAALNLLVQEEHISKNYPVPCNVRDDDNPVEISLAENVVGHRSTRLTSSWPLPSSMHRGSALRRSPAGSG